MTKTTWQTSREHVISTMPSDADSRVGILRRARRRADAVSRAIAGGHVTALEALSCAPRLLERGLLAREDFLHALIDTLEGVMRHVTNGPGVGGLASHHRLLSRPVPYGVAKRKEQQFLASLSILDGSWEVVVAR